MGHTRRDEGAARGWEPALKPEISPNDVTLHVFYYHLRLIAAVWKTVLEETERVGKMRLIAADNYMHDIFEPTKPLKIHKQQMSKKVRKTAAANQVWYNFSFPYCFRISI